MGIFSASGAAQKVGFLDKLSNYLLIFAVIVILINCGLIYYKTQEANQIGTYLGDKLLYTTLSLQNDANSVLNFDYSQDNFHIYLDWLILALNIYLDIWSIIIWFKILSWLYTKLILHNDAMSIVSFILALFTFFGLQMFFLLMKGESVLIPFLAFYDILRALISLTGGRLGSIADRIAPGTSNSTMFKPLNISSNLT